MFISRPSKSVLSVERFVLGDDGGEYDPEPLEEHFVYDISEALNG